MSCRDEDLGHPLGRGERHRVAQFESPLASPLRCQAGGPQGGLGHREIASHDLEAPIPSLLQGIAVELLDQPASMDDADPIREEVDLAEDMAGHEDGDVFGPGQVSQQVADLDHAGGIEAVRGLVEDEEFGTVNQGAREGQPLQVAERERARPPGGVCAERQPLDHRVHPPAILDASEPPCDVEVFDDRQLGIGGRALDEVADAPPEVSCPRGDASAEELGVTGRRLDHPEEHANRRGLAGAVEAEERVDLAPSDSQVHAVDREHVAAVALGQRVGRDG